MKPPSQQTFVVIDTNGVVVFKQQNFTSTLVIGRQEDSDLVVSSNETHYVTPKTKSTHISTQLENGEIVDADFPLGSAFQLGSLTAFAFADPTIQGSEERIENHFSTLKLYDAYNSWMRRPIRDRCSLTQTFQKFLDICVSHSGAARGMLVLAEKGQFNLAAVNGLTAKEAQTTWEKIPTDITEDILKSKTRIILPESLKNSCHDDTTVFITGIKSFAALPILAEEEVVGILFVGFHSIISDLTESIQQALEHVCDQFGLIIQRARFRQQIDNLKLSRSSNESSADTINRTMIGKSEELNQVYKLLAKLAKIDVPVLLTGETGTGKELAAKELHKFSNRHAQTFVAVNAAALPESLAESELFGHKKGSFTGALSDRIGLIEQADKGTLFLDEIGELSASLQSKLLRVLQDHTISKIGDDKSTPVDFRLICATHRDLRKMVLEGKFREDLYYRIAGATIFIPPLRERQTDILPLADYFKENFCNKHGIQNKQWTEAAIHQLKSFHWPGNIRQLENTVYNAIVMAEGNFISPENFGLPIDENIPFKVGENLTLNEAKEDWLRNFIVESLKKHNGKRSETAKALGIGERTLFRYIDQLEIRPN